MKEFEEFFVLKWREATLSEVLSPRRCTKVSVSNAKGPPVPIPNTEVKLCSADNTCLATGRKDRSMLTQAARLL